MNRTQTKCTSFFFLWPEISLYWYNNPEHAFSLKPSGFSYTKWLFKNFRKYYVSLGTGVPLNSLEYTTPNSEVAESLHFNHLNAKQTIPLSFFMPFHHFNRADNQPAIDMGFTEWRSLLFIRLVSASIYETVFLVHG